MDRKTGSGMEKIGRKKEKEEGWNGQKRQGDRP